ncbi:MAG: cobalamin-dependent protein [Acidobacteriota bacterium]|nr:MAG: cobalamin-dependent protein [Acidobacteriota bacterium]
MARNEELFVAICTGDRDSVTRIVQSVLDSNGDVVGLLNESMIPSMREMGERFSRNEVYVPDMLIAARAMQTGLDLIEPVLAEAGHKSAAKVCIGTVKGDLHDIGKNLVAMMLKGAGYEVIDLGVDCDIQKFGKAVSEGAQAVLCSALLTTTMPYMKTLVEHFGQEGIPVIIGGAPVTKEYSDQIGAAGYGGDANQAVKIVDQCLKA